MDCTYNTNRFNIPLLTVIGVTNLGTIFTLGLVFLASEEKEEYIWALTQLKNRYKTIYFIHPVSNVTDADMALISAVQAIFQGHRDFFVGGILQRTLQVAAGLR